MSGYIVVLLDGATKEMKYSSMGNIANGYFHGLPVPRTSNQTRANSGAYLPDENPIEAFTMTPTETCMQQLHGEAR